MKKCNTTQRQTNYVHIIGLWLLENCLELKRIAGYLTNQSKVAYNSPSSSDMMILLPFLCFTSLSIKYLWLLDC